MMKSCMKIVVSFRFLVVITSVTVGVTVDAGTDTITVTTPLRDGDTLVSSGGNFVLGFFSPGSPNSRYVGVWYKKVPLLTPVWIANRDSPLSDTSGVFQITNQSILVIVNSTGNIIWSTNSTKSTLKNPLIAQLLDSGNLVIRGEGKDITETLTWQSFDHPTHVLLPGMKLGLDLITGFSRDLTSWRSSDDPAHGIYTIRFVSQGYPELVAELVGLGRTTELYRFGPWNGLRFSGILRMNPSDRYNYSFVLDQKEVYYTYRLIDTTIISHFSLSASGSAQQIIWNEQTQEWFLSVPIQSDTCDIYATCGVFGCCTTGNTPQCECVVGFVPKYSKAWGTGDWSEGCMRRTQLACNQTGDGFLKYSNVKPPETRFSWYNTSMNLKECEHVCLKNCSCTAYANLDVRAGGSGCLLWFGDLKDIKQFPDNGQDLFVRLASSEIARLRSTNKNRKWIILGCTLSPAMALLGLGLALRMRKKKKQRILHGGDPKELDLPLIDFSVIAQATDYFSLQNKIGEGGFGVVYKGRLEGGQAIAVKKLMNESSQDLDEFKNEVICIAKLQHRNLVKLIGCAVEADDKLLVYEYLPNKSLDSFIFEQAQNTSLDWPKRFNIINGIARGLLYLYQDSRLRIVHRDLKASNVLLDHDLNPKIADFGTARCLYGDESLAKTRRVIGTYGYMSPEYAVDGIFSVKSDVFSFGVLVLEIISGLRNRGFTHEDHHLNLLGHAWIHFQKGEAMKLIGTPMNNEDELSQILRSIHVALMCVQQRSEDRPTMSSVVVMLSSDDELPQPKQPGFFTERNSNDMNSRTSKDELVSINEATITFLAAR